MTENLPGAAGGPAEDPRHPDERADTVHGQPTGHDSGPTAWYSPMDSVQPPRPEPMGGPSQWSPAGQAYYEPAP
ncbi:MAG TPA: hypothetical protein VH352_18345, partial [Pseudonocardiaceae bacterium]|nr:hypothetical protein [Pseudonocardiaceae bacterium]